LLCRENPLPPSPHVRPGVECVMSLVPKSPNAGMARHLSCAEVASQTPIRRVFLASGRKDVLNGTDLYTALMFTWH
jgi:hypothetical protein